MNNNDTNWFNQQLMYYVDNQYGTNSTIDISLSCNSNDYINFTSPTFNLRIYNNETKCYIHNLKYIDSNDLILSIQQLLNNITEIYNNPSNNNTTIYKTYINNKNIQITFKKSMSQEWCTIISIINTKTDYGRIIIPYTIFLNIYDLLKSYKECYIKLCFDFSSRFLLSNILNENKQILNSIKILSTNVINISDNNMTTIDEDKQITTTINDEQQQDFDNFIDLNINDIPIQGINEDKNDLIIDNLFIEKVFNNSMQNVEDFFNTLWTCQNPIRDLMEKIYNQYQFKEDSVNLLDTFLPEISNDDYKSIIYITRYYFSLYLRLYMKNQNDIPVGTPIFKYNIKNKNIISRENLDLSYDLLILMSYIKLFRDKYKEKENDLTKNKSMLYFSMRCFMDVFIFSFLHGKEENSILNCISERYKYYDNKGLFNSYNNMLLSFNLKKIELSDIKSFLQNSLFKFLNKPLFINVLHNDYYNSQKVKLQYKNDLNLEQIINDVINIEVDLKTTDSINIDDIKDDKVKEVFLSSSKQQKESNILRFIKKYINDIPVRYQKDFILYVDKNINDKKFNFNQNEFPLNEFNDIIIKSLYIWDPENDEKQLFNYAYFVEKVNSTKMTKDLILASSTNNKYNNTNGNNWSESIQNLSLNL